MSNKKPQAYEAHELFWTAVKMNTAMLFNFCLATAAVQAVVVALWCYFYRFEQVRLVVEYPASVGIMNIKFPIFNQMLRLAFITILKACYWSSILYLVIPPWLVFRFYRRAVKAREGEHLRGSIILEERQYVKLMEKKGEKCDLPLGGESKLPVSSESKHEFLLGRPGAGKTVMISRKLARLRERGEKKVVIYDTKGDYYARFYQPGDHVFFPMAKNCVAWNLFDADDMTLDTDFATIAAALIPEAQGESNPYFTMAARDVVEAAIRVCWLNSGGKATNADLVQFLEMPPQDWKRHFEDTPRCSGAANHLTKPDANPAISVISTVMANVKRIRLLGPLGSGFSAKRWLEDESAGWIFIVNTPQHAESMNPLLTLFLDLMGRRLLSMPDNLTKRFFFVIDELGMLPRVEILMRLLTFGRSKGAAVICAIQDTAQLDRIYTREGRTSIYNACGTSICFAVADPQTADFISQRLGERERAEVEQSNSMGPSDNRDGISMADRKKTDRAVLPSEIMEQPDLSFYAVVPGVSPFKGKVPFKAFPLVNKALELRDELFLNARSET